MTSRDVGRALGTLRNASRGCLYPQVEEDPWKYMPTAYTLPWAMSLMAIALLVCGSASLVLELAACAMAVGALVVRRRSGVPRKNQRHPRFTTGACFSVAFLSLVMAMGIAGGLESVAVTVDCDELVGRSVTVHMDGVTRDGKLVDEDIEVAVGEPSETRPASGTYTFRVDSSEFDTEEVFYVAESPSVTVDFDRHIGASVSLRIERDEGKIRRVAEERAAEAAEAKAKAEAEAKAKAQREAEAKARAEAEAKEKAEAEAKARAEEEARRQAEAQTAEQAEAEARAKAEAAAAAATAEKNEETVYITKTGECYHRGTCSSLRQSKIAISKDDAIAQGYQACQKCNP